MIKLLRANFYRFTKNKLFWVCVFAAFAVTAAWVLSEASKAAAYAAAGEGEAFSLEEIHFSFMPLLPTLFAVFTSMFFGTEYADRTIRNRLVSGNTRSAVYFSSMLTASVGTLIITAAWFAGGVSGIRYCGAWSLSPAEMARYLCVIVLAALSYTAILTFLFMLCDNKALNVVLSLAAVGVIVLCGSVLYQVLSEDEFTQAAYYYDGTGFVWLPGGEPNPHYIGGALRVLLTSLFYLLPGGQAILAANIEIETPLVMCLYSVIVIVVVSALGNHLFKKKDLK